MNSKRQFQFHVSIWFVFYCSEIVFQIDVRYVKFRILFEIFLLEILMTPNTNRYKLVDWLKDQFLPEMRNTYFLSSFFQLFLFSPSGFSYSETAVDLLIFGAAKLINKTLKLIERVYGKVRGECYRS